MYAAYKPNIRARLNINPAPIHSSEQELYYLVELTKQRVKSLSRWEKPLEEEVRRWIRRQGLVVDVIPRKTLLRRPVYETIFSVSSHYVDYYHHKFFNSPLRKDAASQRLEGMLFGYPSCCVRQFIQRPYTPNGLMREDQEILFHWACPDCRATLDLLSYYRPIHQQVLEWYQQELSHLESTEVKSAHQRQRKLALAAATAMLLATGALAGQIPTDTSHFLPVPDDIDSDGLNYAEELYLGTDFYHRPYTYPDTLMDGELWAGFFSSMIDTLPTTLQSDQPYKIEHLFRGIEYCRKCSTAVNMGYVILVNPLRNLQLDIPFIGLHYLEHGCFSYWGDLHSGRADIDTLKRVLCPYDAAHMLPVTGDSDGDGLTNAEEDSLYLDPYDSDTDGDGVPDGAQVAEQLIRLFPKLKEQADSIHSSVSFHRVWGLENCQVCGAIHNMGFVKFQNPENGDTCQIHFNGLHALSHGSFAYDGTTNPNQRADAVKLYRTMKTHMLFIADDSDNDGLTDSEEAHFGYDPQQADTDGDGVCDGMDLALSLASILDALPTSPIPDDPYVIHYEMDGIYNCLVCGDAVNMGFMELYNPTIDSGSLRISYYAYHFLKKGSFAYEGRIDSDRLYSWHEGRIDPVQFAAYLDYTLGIQPGSGTLPEGFELQQNYPNPFNSLTTLRYELPRRAEVVLMINNIMGRQVRTLVRGQQGPGYKSVTWDSTDDRGRPVSSGVYLYRIQAGEFSQTRKMVLLR